MRYSKSPLNSNDHKEGVKGEFAAPIITLTTDFGSRDYFVGSMKGVLLRIVPNARLIDITHEIPRHDIVSAAFVINEIYRTFPQGTIHLVVVDPGVGTERKKLIVSKKGQLFVAPDNGVLTYLYREKETRIYEVVDTPYLTFSNSPTFAGRDHFAPIAASLAAGIHPEALGREISDYQRIEGLTPESMGSDLAGKIVYFDHFGNAITNLTESVLKKSVRFEVRIKGHSFQGLKRNYAEGDEEEGNLIINSSGHLEIFIPRKSAKEALKLNILDDLLVSHLMDH